jgi:hypothetical protein
MVKVPKWKIEAASTAEAWPRRDALDQVVERADAARGDDRHRHGIGDGAGQREVEAALGAVAVHRGEQDSPAPSFRHRGEGDGVDPGRAAAAMGEDLPAVACPSAETVLASMATTMHWLPNFSAARRRNPGFGDGGRVDRDLVGAGQQQLADVLDVRTPPPTVSGMKHCSAVRPRRRTSCRGSRGWR